MPDQGLIVGVGAIQFPPEYQGSDPATLATMGIGRTLTITSTYDHRVIQGAESGLFLRRVADLLLGSDGFYENIFSAMSIPYVPARWATDTNPPPGSRQWAEKQARVFQLINNYRVRGHLIADLDPLRQHPPAIHPELDPLTYGLSIWDLDREFATGGLAGRTQLPLGAALGILRDAYARTVGLEYMHIQEPDQKLWIQEHVEGQPTGITADDQRRILEKLTEAEAFERFLHTKFLGAKRFSLEGSEALIPLLDSILNDAADSGMAEAVVGMAHRGRLNVLANVVGKPLASMFREFAGDEVESFDPAFSGDVKYHLGASGQHLAPSGTTIRIDVAANPSHLEAVDPVLEGIARAKQDQLGEGAEDIVLPILVHGDAAFAGQGVVAETFNLSQLDGYYTGGTVHVVVNNQVGFTTGTTDARSSHYATDVAKAVQAPIFHVNADDPEAVVRVARLAFQFRQAFHKDVVIDLIAYRRLGHNEGDEPTYTQPRMYQLIEQQRSVRKLYVEKLVNAGEISLEEAEVVLESYRGTLNAALHDSRAGTGPQPAGPAEPLSPPVTAVPLDALSTMERRMESLPDGFSVHPKLAKILREQHEMFEAGIVDWGLAELFAYGSLATSGHRVRLAGEDSQRGTFSHRHAVLVDYASEESFMPLGHLSTDQAPVRIYDSLLSEFAAMGFEYGYSVGDPDALVLWEAQYGDFVNGAQVVIDQFLTTGYDKWSQRSGLGLLLPHGFEGQGSEHSSARLERFLQNAAEDNVRVVVPSTTAQIFHLLRRQALWARRRPLIVMSPKSLLRTRDSYSNIEEFTEGRFRPVIGDDLVTGSARRVLLTSGKLYYDLTRHRDEHEVDSVAVVRVEELYPFPAKDINEVLARHGDAELVWVQEEPANMGAWRFMSRTLFVEAGRSSRGIYRAESASPATGSPQTHVRQQAELIERAFD
jgi:2-oxoglutarate dehydrogenase E1 component